MLDLNNYKVREGKTQVDDFRFILTTPGSEVESGEIFKLKFSDTVYCGSICILGGDLKRKFFSQPAKEKDSAPPYIM